MAYNFYALNSDGVTITTCTLWGTYQRTYETCPLAQPGQGSFISISWEPSWVGFYPSNVIDVTDGRAEPISHPVEDYEPIIRDVLIDETRFSGVEATYHITIDTPGGLVVDNIRHVWASDGTDAAYEITPIIVAGNETVVELYILYNNGIDEGLFGFASGLLILFDVDGTEFSIEYSACIDCF